MQVTIELIKERLYETYKHGQRPSARKLAAKANQALLQALADVTRFLPADASAIERIYAFEHGLTARPVCKTCGQALHPSAFKRFKVSKGYTSFCSTRCAKLHPDTKKKQVDTCMALYGVEHVFAAEVVKDKIKQANLASFGVESSLQAPHVKAAREKGIQAYHADMRRKRIAALKRIGDRRYDGYRVTVDEELFIEELQMLYTHLACGTTFKERLVNGSLPRCPKCDPAKSNITAPHRRIKEVLQPHVELLENKRSLLPPSRKELDLFAPAKKLAIEVNGLYWHSFFEEERSLVQLTKSYHLEKTKLAEANGISLIHVWEHEVDDPRMHDFILSKVGVGRRLYARKLRLSNVSHQEAKAFLLENHLQGSVNSGYQVGLFDGDTLVSLATFGKPRFSKDAEWELLRLCTKRGLNVIGGASRMLSKFVADVKPSSLISYADRRLGAGNVYKALGFSLSHATAPGYFYWMEEAKRLTVISRYMAQKHKLPKLLGVKYDAALTEQQNMLRAGYGLVYDCGQLVFIKRFA